MASGIVSHSQGFSLARFEMTARRHVHWSSLSLSIPEYWAYPGLRCGPVLGKGVAIPQYHGLPTLE